MKLKATLKYIFLRNPNAPAFWLMLGFVIKGILFISVVLNHPFHDIRGIWGATQLDDSSYLLPIDNLLQHGTYFPDFRMPGYGAIYLLFHLFFSQTGTCNALIVLQLILASASVYYLSLTAKSTFKNNSIFYLTFYLFLACSFSNFFDAYIGTESICTSLLIFSVYFFTCYFERQKTRYLFYAGLLATWAMFVRPVFGGVIVICSFLILFQAGRGISIKIKHTFLFLIPFLLCEGSWIYRNFQVHKKFVPFTSTAGAFYPDAATTYLQPLFEFTQSWGGVCSLEDKPVDIDWFQYRYPGMTPITHYDSLQDDIYTSAFNKDSLMVLKRMILAIQNPSIDTALAARYQHQLRIKLTAYKLSVKNEKPFRYFVVAPLKITGVMLYGPETRLYLQRGIVVPFFGELIGVFNNIIYLIVLLSGLIGIIWLIIYGLKQRSFLLIVAFIPLYTILVHSVVFRLHFNRYLMPAYPFLIICSAYFMYTFYIHYLQRKAKG